MVGDTKEECYARCKHVHGYTKRERKREIQKTQNTEERKNSRIAAAFLLYKITFKKNYTF